MHTPDHARSERIGMPEAVLCDAKTAAQVASIVDDLLATTDEPRLLTRLTEEQIDLLASGPHASRLDVDRPSRTAFVGGHFVDRAGFVSIVTAGTSDVAVASEAARTLEFSGVSGQMIADVGVAGLWRLTERLDEIRRSDVVIAVAGMDAALVSVLGGLVAAPIVAVPTSVGYGVAAGGTTALNSALASCAQGVTVVNIDNGFGAACAALRMVGLAERSWAAGRTDGETAVHRTDDATAAAAGANAAADDDANAADAADGDAGNDANVASADAENTARVDSDTSQTAASGATDGVSTGFADTAGSGPSESHGPVVASSPGDPGTHRAQQRQASQR